ncbi:MAG TPA: metallophosphoesterase [Blastocatellia bacterium]|nr:metallophosphoesterase [Blastocatellia bacterium]
MRTFVIGDVHGRLWLLKQLIEGSGIDTKNDKIVFLGDLIDRGENSPGVVEYVTKLKSENPNVITLRGNHEQMLLDFIDNTDMSWLHPSNGGARTLAQYGSPVEGDDGFTNLKIPSHHIDYFRSTIFFHEDKDAIYVHAGLTLGVHPSKEDPRKLLWSRNQEFYDYYDGKLCIFGHTPTRCIKNGTFRHAHDIFVGRKAIGIDTGYRDDDPLSCIEIGTLTVYQKFFEGGVSSYKVKLN